MLRRFWKRLKLSASSDRVFAVPDDVNAVGGAVKLGEVWQIGNKFYQVHKFSTKGRIVVKPVNIRAKR